MDDLERRIRAARPPSGNRHMPLSDRAKRDLAELLLWDAQTFAGKPPPPVPRRTLGMRWLASAATVALVLLLGGAWWLGGSQPAQAATPPLLAVKPLADPDAAVLADLAAAARASKLSVPAEGEDIIIRVQSWVLRMQEVDGEIDPSLTVISPEVHAFTSRPDGSMSQVVTAGRAYDRAGDPVSDQYPLVGKVLGTFEQSPGEYAPLFTTATPRDNEQIEAFLTIGSGLPTDESAANAFAAIRYLLMEQRLDGPQTAALLEFLATLPDYSIEGTTTDRLGRPALVLTAPRPAGEFTDSLLLDPSTGQVLGSETTYTGTSRTDLTAPAVTEYHAWENTT